MPESETVVVSLTLALVLGIGAQWVAWRLRLPSIILLLLAGLTIGPFLGILNPDELFGRLLFPVVSVSVGLILYEGGLSLRLSDLPKVGSIVRNLVTVGAGITWVLTAIAARYVLGMDWAIAVLLGAILVVTGPTVIQPLLHQIRPSGPVGPVLRWEGIVIDPIGAILTVLVFEIIMIRNPLAVPAEVAEVLFKTIVAGFGIGLAAAVILVIFLRRYWIPDFLQNAFNLTLVIAAFAISNHIQKESGLLATTVMGFALANQKIADIKHIVEFKENLRVLLITGLFVVLAARVNLEALTVAGPAMLVFLALLIILIRPISVLASTVKTSLNWRERAFLCAMAPRGIVAAAISSIFAVELEHNNVPGAEYLVSTTFLVIIATVAVYGLAASGVAKWLGVADPNPQGLLIIGAQPWARDLAKIIKNKGFRVVMIDSNRHNTAAARMEGITTYTGSALGDEPLETLDFGGLGKVLAMTPNDWVNVLAAEHFAGIFNRANIYQLAPERDSRRGTHEHLYTRQLFGPDMTYRIIQQRFASGAIIKATRITDEFSYKGFKSLYGPSAVPLFVIRASGRLVPFTTENGTTQPEPGDTLIALVKEKPEHEDPKEKKAAKKAKAEKPHGDEKKPGEKMPD